MFSTDVLNIIYKRYIFKSFSVWVLLVEQLYLLGETWLKEVYLIIFTSFLCFATEYYNSVIKEIGRGMIKSTFWNWPLNIGIYPESISYYHSFDIELNMPTSLKSSLSWFIPPNIISKFLKLFMVWPWRASGAFPFGWICYHFILLTLRRFTFQRSFSLNPLR